MQRFHPLATIGLATLLLLLPPLASAGDGHDHGDAAPATAGSALPRFAAASDLFELVGVLDGRQITLYLDRAADNSPVSEAQIELAIGEQTFKATRQGADSFAVMLPAAPAPGVLPITATVTAGSDADLLAAELDIHAPAHADAAAHAQTWKTWQTTAGWAAAGVAGLAVLAVLLAIGRRVLASRQARAGGAA